MDGLSILFWFLNALYIFVLAFVLIRIVGQRTIQQMSTLDLAVIAVSGSFFASGLRDYNKWFQTGVTGAFFFLIYFGATYLMLNNKFREWVHDKPTVLVSQGNINETGLRKARMTVAELLGELRIKGITSASDVEFAILEGEGGFSVIPKVSKSPVTLEDLHLPAKERSMAVPVIIAGELIEDNLHILRRDRQWLEDQLAQHDLSSDDIPQLTLVSVEPNGNLHIDRDEPAQQGKWLDHLSIGQYASRKQAELATMPGYHNIPGIAESTKRALDQKEQQQSAPSAQQDQPSSQMEQLQIILSQVQQQQTMQQQLLAQVEQLIQQNQAQSQPQQ